MSTPRNPRYFPRMKVRGARRRRLESWHRAQRSFDEVEAAMRRIADESGHAALSLQQFYRVLLQEPLAD